MKRAKGENKSVGVVSATIRVQEELGLPRLINTHPGW
jgi:hypothetical protein